MKKILVILFMGLSICKAQNIIKNDISIGITDSLHSTILNETQHFWVSLPTSFYNPKFAKSRYPVIYVFDGNANFATVAAMQKQLSIRNGNSVLPEAIVVGILNNARSRDFTPYKSSFWIYDTPSPLEDSGGGEKFAAYLEKELLPHIDSVYPTSPYRVLLGHSLGGLEATNILVNHTELFNAYVLMDPSMWYDNQGFLNKAAQTMLSKRFDGTSVYLAMANTMSPGLTIEKVTADKTNNTLHIRSIIRLNHLLEKESKDGLRFKFDYYADNTHMSLPLIAEYTGLRFIFDYYQIPPKLENAFLNPKDHTDPAKVFTQHYQVISAHMGFKVTPSESLVNVFANTMSDYYLPEKALGLYELNVKNYPQSNGAWSSLGEFYEEQKNFPKAISCYEKALGLKEDQGIRERLKKLENLK